MKIGHLAGMVTHTRPDLGAWQPTADELFAALDHYDVENADHHWEIEISAIVDDTQHHHRLVQLTLTGEPSYMLVLRLSEGANASQAIHHLSDWLADPEAIDVDVLSAISLDSGVLG